MPPSGYTSNDIQGILSFLESCSIALEEQSVHLGVSPISALDKECQGIEAALTNNSANAFARKVLELTYVFYKDLLKREPKDFEHFSLIVGESLKVVSEELLSVHVPQSH